MYASFLKIRAPCPACGGRAFYCAVYLGDFLRNHQPWQYQMLAHVNLFAPETSKLVESTHEGQYMRTRTFPVGMLAALLVVALTSGSWADGRGIREATRSAGGVLLEGRLESGW